MDATIVVERLDVMDFVVTVTDDTGSSQHTVIATQEDHVNYAAQATLEALVIEVFRFMLAHEPRSMIPTHVSVQKVSQEFPDFAFEMQQRFAA